MNLESFIYLVGFALILFLVFQYVIFQKKCSDIKTIIESRLPRGYYPVKSFLKERCGMGVLLNPVSSHFLVCASLIDPLIGHLNKKNDLNLFTNKLVSLVLDDPDNIRFEYDKDYTHGENVYKIYKTFIKGESNLEGHSLFIPFASDKIVGLSCLAGKGHYKIVELEKILTDMMNHKLKVQHHFALYTISL